MKKIVFIILFGSISLLAQSLKNNQTIILTSNSTYEYAKACFDMLKPYFKNETAFILKSDSGYYMVTTGIYSNKQEVYKAMSELPQKLKDEKPFRATLKYDLTSQDDHILFAQNLPKKMPRIKINNKEFEQMDKDIVHELMQQNKSQEKQKESKLNVNEESNWVDSMSLSFGQNWKNHDIYRIALQKNFLNKYFESSAGYLSGFYDLSLNQIEYSSNVYALAFTPVFAYYFNTHNAYHPYIYGGVGASYISRTRVEEKDFSSAFQFEDQLGFGIKTDDMNFQLGYVHYSNANIKKPNDGIDIGLFSIIFNF